MEGRGRKFCGKPKLASGCSANDDDDDDGNISCVFERRHDDSIFCISLATLLLISS
jgi:hypothetical protein